MKILTAFSLCCLHRTTLFERVRWIRSSTVVEDIRMMESVNKSNLHTDQVLISFHYDLLLFKGRHAIVFQSIDMNVCYLEAEKYTS
jgi:hypothetical protein